MTLLSLIRSRLGPDIIEQLARRIHADPGATSNAVDAAAPLLLSAIAGHVAEAGGAQALHATLKAHHDGSLLDNLPLHLAYGETNDGDAIIGHVLGPRAAAFESGIGRATGLDADQVRRLLALLAPVVMAAIAAMQRERELDPAGLAALMTQERSTLETAAPGVLHALGGMLAQDTERSEAGGILGSVFEERP